METRIDCWCIHGRDGLSLSLYKNREICELICNLANSKSIGGEPCFVVPVTVTITERPDSAE
jgi:hypothetical protein